MKDKIFNEKGQPMIVLAIGDVVGSVGCRFLREWISFAAAFES